MSKPFVSILMLTHNAPDYVRTSIESLRNLTKNVNYELVVVDNESQDETKNLVKDFKQKGLIDRLVLNAENKFFAGGKNIAAKAASPNATHYLLLDSDVEIRRSDWLSHLLDIHPEKGISAYGLVLSEPIRADGYCLLINADLYQTYNGLDENHHFHWSITKLQAAIISDGYLVQGYPEHEKYIHHFWGKSGGIPKSAKGMHVDMADIIKLFNGKIPRILTVRKSLFERFYEYFQK